MITSHEIITLLNESGSFGMGWWLSLINGRLIEMRYEDLGPHGDHDGWISLADNARKLGIDRETAQGYQDATFGFEVDKHHPLYEYSKIGWVGEGWIFYGDFRGSTKPEVIQAKKVISDYFVQKFGSPPEHLEHTKFPDLIRARWWPPRLLSFTTDRLTAHHLKLIIRYLPEIMEEVGVRKIEKVTISDENETSYSLTSKEAYSLEKISDLRRIRQA
jgi:hypothetical protein